MWLSFTDVDVESSDFDKVELFNISKMEDREIATAAMQTPRCPRGMEPLARPSSSAAPILGCPAMIRPVALKPSRPDA